MAKKITTNFDEVITVTNDMVFVTATDKMFSGWGCAENRICKRVIICENDRQAQRMADAFKNNKNGGMIYVNITRKMPYYSEGRYKVVYSTFSDFSGWLKYTNITE